MEGAALYSVKWYRNEQEHINHIISQNLRKKYIDTLICMG